MAKKKNNNGGGGGNNNNNNNDGGEKNNNNNDGGEKKEDGPITVVLKVDMHCEGCATKIVKCVKDFQGVETVKSEFQANKLTVVGKVDPAKLRDKLAAKSKKKVDLISPQPKKDNKDKDDANDNKKKQPEKSNDDKKPKEAPVTTAVLKLNLHCQGCIEKIQKAVSKTKGFHEMSIDKEKDLVTVKGSMDMKKLAENMKERLKRPVDIVPPKKEKEKGKEGGENGGGGGGEKKKNEGGEGNAGGGKLEHTPGEPQFVPGYAPYPGYGYPPPPASIYTGNPLHPGYGYPPQPAPIYTGNPLHAPQMFSDENPNACSIM